MTDGARVSGGCRVRNAQDGAARERIAMVAFVVALVLSASAVPTLPQAYTAHIAFGECGNVGACQLPLDRRVTSTDGEAHEADAVHVLLGPKAGTDLNVVTTAAAQYQWDRGDADCVAQKYGFPIQSDWAWLGLNTTTGPTDAPCVTDPSAKCTVWQGPWPEQVTSEAKLWLRKGDVPDSLQMTCSMIPRNCTAARTLDCIAARPAIARLPSIRAPQWPCLHACA